MKARSVQKVTVLRQRSQRPLGTLSYQSLLLPCCPGSRRVAPQRIDRAQRTAAPRAGAMAASRAVRSLGALAQKSEDLRGPYAHPRPRTAVGCAINVILCEGGGSRWAERDPRLRGDDDKSSRRSKANRPVHGTHPHSTPNFRSISSRMSSISAPLASQPVKCRQ